VPGVSANPSGMHRQTLHCARSACPFKDQAATCVDHELLLYLHGERGGQHERLRSPIKAANNSNIACTEAPSLGVRPD